MKKIHREILNELPLVLETEQGDFLEILHNLLRSYYPSRYSPQTKWDRDEISIFMEKATDTDLLNSLKRKNKMQDKTTKQMEEPLPIFPEESIPSIPHLDKVITCPKCGMVWKGAMLYSCPSSHCPIQPKVTC